MDSRGHQTGDVRDIGKEHRVDFVGDLTKCLEIDAAGVGRRAALDHLGPVLPGEIAHLVVIDVLV